MENLDKFLKFLNEMFTRESARSWAEAAAAAEKRGESDQRPSCGGPTLGEIYASRLAEAGADHTATVEKGAQKYLRVVSTRYGTQRSVYCFIDLANGDILKPDGWKRPAKHARGNLAKETGWVNCCSPYGVAYLR